MFCLPVVDTWFFLIWVEPSATDRVIPAHIVTKKKVEMGSEKGFPDALTPVLKPMIG